MESDVVIKSSENLAYIFTMSALLFFMLVESFVPRCKIDGGLVWRWSNNFILGGITWFTIHLVTLGFLFWLARWTEIRQFGLFNYLDVPLPVAFLALLLISQLLTYSIHIAFHKIPMLWHIHAVHHSDTELDVSTSFRNHPFEALIPLPVVAPIILLLGIPAPAAVAVHLFEIGMSVFTHSNVYLPEKLDRLLRKVIVTPDYHRLHHCSERKHTDSNYGAALPWFDYIFGTASNRPFKEQESMTIGLEYLREPADSRFDRLLSLPFFWKKRARDN